MKGFFERYTIYSRKRIENLVTVFHIKRNCFEGLDKDLKLLNAQKQGWTSHMDAMFNLNKVVLELLAFKDEVFLVLTDGLDVLDNVAAFKVKSDDLD